MLDRQELLAIRLAVCTVFALFFLFSGLSACSTVTVPITLVEPGTVDLKGKGIRSLAVSDFDGLGESGKKVAETFTAKLAEGQHFKIVERDKLLAMEKEQALGMTGVVSENMAAKAGKLLGVDALVVGKVTEYSVKDEPYTRTVMRSRATGTYRTECDKKGNCYKVENYEQVPVKEDHHIRSGTVAVSFRVVRTETGEVLVGKQQAENYKYDTGNPPSKGLLLGRKEELGSDEVLAGLTQEIVAKLSSEIQPHPVTYQAIVETGGTFFSDAQVMHGIELIRANRAEDAIQHYEGVARNNPQNSSAYYNLGVAYEMIGELNKAEEAYRAAEKIEPKPLYVKAVGLIKQEKEKQRKRNQAASQ